MKKLITLSLALFCCVAVDAQTKVKEKDLIGEWKLVIDLDEVEEEIERELEDEHWLASRFARSISNFALDIVSEIDIRMDFREDGEVRIEVDAFGAREVEYSEWYINRDGELIIEDDDNDRRRRSRRNRSVHFGNDHDVWMMDGNKLFAYDRGYRGRLKKQEVYMVKR